MPVRTRPAHDRPLAPASSGSAADAAGIARRDAAFALVAAVLVGSAGSALAVGAVSRDAVAAGLVVAIVVLAGALVAANAWRNGFR